MKGSETQLELTDEDATVQRDFLSSRLGELSMEIADTDNPRFRRELVRRRGILLRIDGALAPARPPGSVGAVGRPIADGGLRRALRELQAEQCVLDDLRQRRVDPVLTARDVADVLLSLDQRLDDRRGLRADDLRAEESVGGAVGARR